MLSLNITQHDLYGISLGILVGKVQKFVLQIKCIYDHISLRLKKKIRTPNPVSNSVLWLIYGCVIVIYWLNSNLVLVRWFFTDMCLLHFEKKREILSFRSFEGAKSISSLKILSSKMFLALYSCESKLNKTCSYLTKSVYSAIN